MDQIFVIILAEVCSKRRDSYMAKERFANLAHEVMSWHSSEKLITVGFIAVRLGLSKVAKRPTRVTALGSID